MYSGMAIFRPGRKLNNSLIESRGLHYASDKISVKRLWFSYMVLAWRSDTEYISQPSHFASSSMFTFGVWQPQTGRGATNVPQQTHMQMQYKIKKCSPPESPHECK